MSVPAPSELDPLLTRQRHRQFSCCCKLSYKPRKFLSKGAVLVLAWLFLVICSVLIVQLDITNQIRNETGVSLEVIAVLPLVLVAIISGWLADTKVGRSKVVQAGLSLTWLGVVLATVGNVLNLSLHTTITALNGVIQAVQYVAFCATYGGAAVFCTNVVQFGLEQMPDASSDAMTAYISWIALVTFLGEGSFNLAVTLLQHFISFHNIIVVRAIVACSLLPRVGVARKARSSDRSCPYVCLFVCLSVLKTR